MSEKNRNVLIANGHELIGDLSWPQGGGKKWLPYSIVDVRNILHKEIEDITNFAKSINPQFTPKGEVTAKIILHPAFLAKSYFPAGILRDSGLVILGSRPVKITPRKSRDDIKKEQETASIFVSGTADNFRLMNENLFDLNAAESKKSQFARIEDLGVYEATEKLRVNSDTRWPDHVHITLHASETDAYVLSSFKDLIEELGGKLSNRGFRFVSGLTFITVKISPEKIPLIAQFTRVRIIRSLPELQDELKLKDNMLKSYGAVNLPTDSPASEIRTAIFDGGIANAFPTHATEIANANQPPSSTNELSHGVNVTSAFLYGNIKQGNGNLPTPYCYVDHHRVLPTSDSPEQALDVLDRIITVLRSAKVTGKPYRFANISMGPIATFFDDDVHEWTSRLDTELADGQTLCAAAIGNNGLADGELARIQPPGDAVNVLSVGAADSTEKKWNKAPYSAVGPGRSPGYVKPDLVAFGGSTQEPLSVFNPLANSVVGVAGTSFATPLALRVAVGTDVLSGSVFDPVTLQALLINGCDFSTRSHSRADVGWGRTPLDAEDILYTPQDVVRVVYQGITRPGHPQKAIIPIPKGLPDDLSITIGATFCYRAPVDSAHAINYTRAGLWVRAYKAPKKSLPLFGSGMYKTESELRKDSMRWDTVLHNKRKIAVKDLDNPYFHINYQVRDEGESVRIEDAVPMPYALVVTIEAPGIIDLLSRVQTDFPVLNTLPISVEQDISIRT